MSDRSTPLSWSVPLTLSTWTFCASFDANTLRKIPRSRSPLNFWKSYCLSTVFVHLISCIFLVLLLFNCYYLRQGWYRWRCFAYVSLFLSVCLSVFLSICLSVY